MVGKMGSHHSIVEQDGDAGTGCVCEDRITPPERPHRTSDRPFWTHLSSRSERVLLLQTSLRLPSLRKLCSPHTTRTAHGLMSISKEPSVDEILRMQPT
jgi:hypothetical protein